MKNIIKVFTVLALFAFAGCTENGPEGGKELNENIQFTAKVLQVKGTSATIKVEHNGTEADTWYGFHTTETDIMKAYQDKVNELTKNGGKITGLENSVEVTKPIKNLEPLTKYIYVVFGITEDGEVYGAPAASEAFTTGMELVDMTVNSAWEVEYIGEYTLTDNEGKEKTFKHTATVASTDQNKYFVRAWDVATVDQVGIETIAAYEYASLKSTIEYYNSIGDPVTMDDFVYTGSTPTPTPVYDIYPDDWYILAIGISEDDKLSGLYAKSEVITIEEEVATEDFASWIGTWTVKGDNGTTCDVVFEKIYNNIAYAMTGWEQDIPIYVEWNEEYSEWVIYATNYGEYELDEGVFVDLWLVGANDATGVWPIENMPICYGGTQDGTKFSIPYTEEDEGEIVFSLYTMKFVGMTGSGDDIKLMYWTESKDIPSFPCTFEKSESAPANNAAETAKASYKKSRKLNRQNTKAPFKGIAKPAQMGSYKPSFK